MTGTVQAPAGQLAKSVPTLTQWFASLLTGTESYALDVTGWGSVANATVRAFVIDDNGNPAGPVLATTTTAADGSFTLNLPNGTPLASHLIAQIEADPNINGPVAVGTANTLSVPIVAGTITVNPATEAATRALVQRPEPLANFSNQEVTEFLDGVSMLVEQNPPPPGSVETVVNNIAQTQGPAITSGLGAIGTPGVAPLTILTTSLPNAVVQSPYARSLAAVGGTGTKTWSISIGALPTGLTLNATTGRISGTPTAQGTANFTVQVLDSGSPQQSATNQFSLTVTATSGTPPPPMTINRAGHAAVRLANGQVLITGGFSSSIFPAPALNTAELYDPTANTFTALTATMRSARTSHTATLLPNGQVLLTGGHVDTEGDGNNSAELYDPATQTFTAITATMTSPRGGHVAVSLPNGQVLLAGGFNNEPVALNSAELYNPTTQTFTALVATMASRRESPTATRLPDGKVLIAGGGSSDVSFNTAELYDPQANTFTALTATMTAAREGHRAALLPSGQVLLTGGFIESSSTRVILNTMEVYDPAAQTFTAATALMTSPRAFHDATLLSDGQVLLTGGVNVVSTNFVGVLNTAEVYRP